MASNSAPSWPGTLLLSLGNELETLALPETSMLLLLGTTLVSLILNFNCYKNFGMNRHNKNWFYEDLFLPDWMYGKAFIITVELVCILICSMFILLVL